MKGKKLKIEKMQKGDILLFQDITGAATHTFIAIGQSIFSHRKGASANVTHAGIYDGGGNILESSGAAGLRSMELMEKHKGYKFQVYRLNSTHKKVAQAASDWADRLIIKRVGGRNPQKGLAGMILEWRQRACSPFQGAAKAQKKAVIELLKDPEADRGFYC